MQEIIFVYVCYVFMKMKKRKEIGECIAKSDFREILKYQNRYRFKNPTSVRLYLE